LIESVRTRPKSILPVPIAGRGERVTIGTDGKREAVKLGDAAELGKIYRKEAWNTYRIICRGPEIALYINGTLMAEGAWLQRKA
jgi:hypothetical protein